MVTASVGAEVEWMMKRPVTVLKPEEPISDADRLARVLRALVATSDHIGMATLARVGRDVLACLHRADVVALMSTHARLMRVGDRSIRAIWDLEDLSG